MRQRSHFSFVVLHMYSTRIILFECIRHCWSTNNDGGRTPSEADWSSIQFTNRIRFNNVKPLGIITIISADVWKTKAWSLPTSRHTRSKLRRVLTYIARCMAWTQSSVHRCSPCELIVRWSVATIKWRHMLATSAARRSAAPFKYFQTTAMESRGRAPKLSHVELRVISKLNARDRGSADRSSTHTVDLFACPRNKCTCRDIYIIQYAYRHHTSEESGHKRANHSLNQTQIQYIKIEIYKSAIQMYDMVNQIKSNQFIV